MKTLPNESASRPALVPHPTFAQAFWFWVKLGLISFGGPAGQIAIMQTELVDRKKWISQSRFLHALNYCMLLPGPEAQQLATYIGWLLHGIRGGIVAGAFFVLPSVFGKKALCNEVMWSIVAAAFVAIYFLKVPFPFVVLGAGFIGLLGGYFAPAKFRIVSGHGHDSDDSVLVDNTGAESQWTAGWLRALKVTGVCLALG